MVAHEQVHLLNGVEEASECAQLMVGSEPWLTLRVPFKTAFAVLTDPGKEVHAVRDARGIAGFIVLDMRGLVTGYIQTVCVRPDCRGRGLGTRLIRWAEDRIFRDSPNVFMCVSSFNTDARRLYERLGFEPVGVLREFIVTEHDEVLLRKTRGTWKEFREKSVQGEE